MKKIFTTIIAIIAISFVSHAGQWQQDETGLRYQNDNGTYKTGWHQDLDGRWYYLDEETTYMLENTTTPDGYTVGEDGAMYEDGKTYDGYDNKLELTIEKTSRPGGIDVLKNPISATVYYNNQYTLESGAIMYIDGIELSKDGVHYVKYRLSKSSEFEEVKIKKVFQLLDGSYDVRDNGIRTHHDILDSSDALIRGIPMGKNYAVSAKIYIGVE